VDWRNLTSLRVKRGLAQKALYWKNSPQCTEAGAKVVPSRNKIVTASCRELHGYIPTRYPPL